MANIFGFTNPGGSAPSNAYEQAFADTRRSQGQANYGTYVRNDPLRTQNRLVYNAGIARESYFRSTGDNPQARSGLWKILQTDTQTNTPPYVEAASKLWSTSLAYKGLISYSSHVEAAPSTDDKVAAQTNPLVPALRQSGINYAFQFHYNPGSVSMAYGGPPDIDVTMLTSGKSKFNSYGPSTGGGSVSFNLVLNRINDMKYFDLKTQKLKAGVSKNAFSGRLPDDRELADIYNRGTMYDMEFLFRTLLGYELESSLGRGMSWDKKTADIGWLGGKPVELHLGKSLRYLGRIVGVQINHVLFTERMVPMFSEVSITLQRLPDIGGSASPQSTPTTTNSVTTMLPGGIFTTITGPNAASFESDIANGGKLYGDLDFGSLFD